MQPHAALLSYFALIAFIAYVLSKILVLGFLVGLGHQRSCFLAISSYLY